ncbi:hypothetical protein K437DRAFT_293968 [Tilletiaria anomala UBC 951]|uniref:Uncharacterized protein n=1 Tax=Tilletiaria anomala (strain ATCC 24038 / CBS 436.72 / UBC 951) TaxID=1037660 RepID=A0A066W1W8_TILAU|nr:uncharacterized protein K437DRAFT_293968 [Tilletiaria anomala UBC 951]KDN47942.1 hypothetical protein K437DRAFT_293968 [Tilletiaria anomala UBC 951]
MIPPTEHLQQALQTVLHASVAFTSPDPSTRAHGEAIFLQVRSADNALDYAVFFIGVSSSFSFSFSFSFSSSSLSFPFSALHAEHSQDAFTTFQSFNMVLHALPHLTPNRQPHLAQNGRSTPAAPLSEYIPSFAALRDFLTHITVQRSHAVDVDAYRASATASSNSSNAGSAAGPLAKQWPAYVRARALQTVAAVSKKALAEEIDVVSSSSHPATTADTESDHQLHAVAARHLQPAQNLLHRLLLSPYASDGNSQDSEAAFWADRHVGAALLRALLEEFGLTHVHLGDRGAGDDDGDSGGDGWHDSDRSSRGQGREAAAEHSSSAHTGLTAVQHLLCKAAFQRGVYRNALSLILHNVKQLVDIHEHRSGGSAHHSDGQTGAAADARSQTVFSACLATLEGLLGWSFLRSDSLARIIASSSDGTAGSSLPVDALQQQQQQELLDTLLSPDLLLLVAAAYRHAAALDSRQPTSVNSIALHRARQCLLLAFSLADNLPFLSSASSSHHHHHHHSSRQPHDQEQQYDVRRRMLQCRLETQLYLLKALIREHAPRGTLVAHGNGLLFLAQLARRTFASPTNGASALCSVLHLQGPAPAPEGTASQQQQLLDLLDALAQLNHAVFSFAFERSRQTQEEDDLQALAEDATDALLGCWHTLVGSIRGQLALSGIGVDAQALHTLWAAVQVGLQDELVQPYIRGRLAAARISVEDHDDDLFSEQGDEAQKDRELYSDQLISIGLLARINAAQSVRLLRDELRLRLSAAVGQGDAARAQTASAEAEAAALWEQIHWLLLIAGHVVADSNSGETPTPPIELTSLANAASADADEALLLEGFLGDVGIENFSRFAHMPVQVISPQVMETYVWFIGRWATSYVLSSDGPFSASHSAGSVSRSETGVMALNSVTSALARVLETWTAEADVVKEVAATLKGFQLSETIPSILIEQQELRALLTAAINAMPVLPAGTHGDLLAALVGLLFVAQAQAQATAESYFGQVTSYIHGRFEALVQGGSELSQLARNAQSAETIVEVQKLLDMLEGLARAIQPRSSRVIFAFQAQFFHALNQLCRTYAGRADIVLLVLRIYDSLASALDFSFDPADDTLISRQFNEALWHYLDILRADRETLGLLGRGSVEADEPFEGLRRGLDLLPILAASVLQQDQQDQQEPALIPAPEVALAGPSLSPERSEDLCLFAFVSLAPLVSDDALKTPSLAFSFSAACADVTRACAKRIVSLTASPASATSAADLLGSVAAALCKALKADTAEAVLNALTSAKALASATAQLTPSASSAVTAMQAPMQHILFELLKTLLFEPVSTSLLDEFILTVQSQLIALSRPQFGGEEALSAALHQFCTDVTVSTSVVGTGEAAVQAVQAFFVASQQHRPQQVVNGNGHVDGHALGHRSLNIRARARMQALADRAAATAFCQAARSAVLKARAGIRVR